MVTEETMSIRLMPPTFELLCSMIERQPGERALINTIGTLVWLWIVKYPAAGRPPGRTRNTGFVSDTVKYFEAACAPLPSRAAATAAAIILRIGQLLLVNTHGPQYDDHSSKTGQRAG